MITYYNRCCAMCTNHKPQLGGGVRFILGLRQWVCQGCKTDIDRKKPQPIKARAKVRHVSAQGEN